jgi:hypothetical protein
MLRGLTSEGVLAALAESPLLGEPIEAAIFGAAARAELRDTASP